MPMWIGALGGGLDYEIEVPDGGVFQADFGLAVIRGRRKGHPRRVEFSVSVASGESFEVLESLLVLRNRGEGGEWAPVEIDLSAYAGRTITLRLEVTPSETLARRQIVWWGSPRLISRLD
jgi:hypothetical protein